MKNEISNFWLYLFIFFLFDNFLINLILYVKLLLFKGSSVIEI